MPRKLLITPRASADLDEIWTYIARDNIEVANRVEDDLHRAIRELVRFPGKGHLRQDAHDATLRFWMAYRYLIGYRYDNELVTVVRVIHGSRHLGKMKE